MEYIFSRIENNIIKTLTFEGIYKEFKLIKEAWKYFEDTKRNRTIFFHEGGLRDLHFFKPVPGMEIKKQVGDDIILMTKVKYFRDKNQKLNKIRINLRDSSRIWPVNLFDIKEWTKEEDSLKALLSFAKRTNKYFNLDNYKSTIGKTAFSYWKETSPNEYQSTFNKLDKDEHFFLKRYVFNGGLMYVKPSEKYVMQDKVFSYDLNSAYSGIYGYKKLPYGKPSYKDKKDHTYKIYDVKVKEATTKTIPFFKLLKFAPQERLKLKMDYSTTIENKTIRMDNYILDVFKKNYIGEYEVKLVMCFKEKKKLLKTFFDKFKDLKENKDICVSKLGKMFLNNIYGKFAEKNWAQNTENLSYIPVAMSIVSQTKAHLINIITENWDVFISCNTDSIHTKVDISDKLNIDKNKIGYWKCEGEFNKGYFRGPAQYYLYNNDEDFKIAISGLYADNLTPKQISIEEFTKDKLTFENGRIYYEPLPNGIKITSTKYTLRKEV